MISSLITIIFIAISIIMFIKFCKSDDKFDNLHYILIGLVILLISFFPMIVEYDVYQIPIIEKEIHEQCVEQGFDTFESWKGVGFFPTEATYVKCKFYTNRMNLDGNVNLNLLKQENKNIEIIY